MSQKALKVPRALTTNLSYTSPTITSNPQICLQCTYRSRSIQARHFTSSRSQNAHLGGMQRAPMAKQPSMKAKIARMDKGQMGDDIGRIPNTIILPSAWEDYPAGLKMKAKLLWRKFSDTVVGMSTLIYATKWDVPKDKRTGKSKRSPLQLGIRLELGRTFHRGLNKALADGNLRGLKGICASGLYENCKKMIGDAKEKGFGRQEWILLSYQGIEYPRRLERWPLSTFLPNSAARVVSDRVLAIPFGKQSYLRECIVRIRSVQAVRIYDGEEPRDLVQGTRTEYIVLQKFNLEGEEGDWKVWGTIDPSKEELHDILSRTLKDSSQNAVVEEFKSRISSMTGL